MTRLTPLAALALLALGLVACTDTVTEPPDKNAPTSQAEVEEVVDCTLQNNNTIQKLTECVTLDGVRAHQAALQAIADANGGTRASGTPGYDASVDYVVGVLAGAGYDVTIQPFEYTGFRLLGPSTLQQLGPAPTLYDEGGDYDVMTQSEPGDVTAPVTAVDLDLGLGNASTSGCEAADFAGFPVGHIALIQRGACTFSTKAENAAAAGAVGAIIFNQGNTPERTVLLQGTLGPAYAGGIPVMETTYDRGVEWAYTPGLEMRMFANVFRGAITTANVLAESSDGASDNVVTAGAHLDSVNEGPGIQDNGSGVAALLETAVQMQRVKPRNQVRFAFWGATEAGNRGSAYYLSNAGAGLEDIALYLSFAVIGSPNYALFVYDGDGSDTGFPQAPGSEAIEVFFEDFYADRGLPFEPTDLVKDAFGFQSAGIPLGGIFTGTVGVKTPEQVALFGGVAGEQYDPCSHLACDTYDNVSLQALDVNSDAVAAAVLQFAMSTEAVNGRRGKGNFGPNPMGPPSDVGPTRAGPAIR